MGGARWAAVFWTRCGRCTHELTAATSFSYPQSVCVVKAAKRPAQTKGSQQVPPLSEMVLTDDSYWGRKTIFFGEEGMPLDGPCSYVWPHTSGHTSSTPSHSSLKAGDEV